MVLHYGFVLIPEQILYEAHLLPFRAALVIEPTQRDAHMVPAFAVRCDDKYLHLADAARECPLNLKTTVASRIRTPCARLYSVLFWKFHKNRIGGVERSVATVSQSGD